VASDVVMIGVSTDVNHEAKNNEDLAGKVSKMKTNRRFVTLQ
jgi:hypothetical protein